MIAVFLTGCCLLPGHDVRQFFIGKVVSEKPDVAALAGSYVVSVDRRAGSTGVPDTVLQLNADGTLAIHGDLTVIASAAKLPHAGPSGITGTWELAKMDSDTVWGVEICVTGTSGTQSYHQWYILRNGDSYELGTFHGDPDQGEIIELKRGATPATQAIAPAH